MPNKYLFIWDTMQMQSGLNLYAQCLGCLRYGISSHNVSSRDACAADDFAALLKQKMPLIRPLAKINDRQQPY